MSALAVAIVAPAAILLASAPIAFLTRKRVTSAAILTLLALGSAAAFLAVAPLDREEGGRAAER